MITPLFDVSQCPRTVTVTVRAPFSRPRDFEISAVGCDFHFCCAPYLLHLRFPGGVQSDGDAASASYDFDAGEATIVLEKSETGVHFPHLGSLSALLVKRAEGLQPPRPPSAKIQVLGSSPAAEHSGDSNASAIGNVDCSLGNVDCTLRSLKLDDPPSPPPPVPHSDDAAFGLSSLASICATPDDFVTPDTVEQGQGTLGACERDAKPASNVEESAEDAVKSLSAGPPRYGFGDRYENVFVVRAENTSEVVELSAPDSTPAWRRCVIRTREEIESFDPEHYVADYMEADEIFRDALDFQPDCIAKRAFTVGDKRALIELPKREYLADIDSQTAADLAGILFAACYDLRCTIGERSCESAWTISRLTPVISYLEHAENVEAAVRSAYIASLTRPLYRHRGLSDRVLHDMRQMMSGDMEDIRARLLRTLLDLRSLYEESPVYRIFSDIYMTDYCIWIQHVEDNVLASLAKDVLGSTVPAECLPWNLSRLQKYAEQIDNNEDPDDPTPIWSWDGTPSPGGESFGVNREPESAASSVCEDTPPSLECTPKVGSEEETRSPKIVISAQHPVRPASFDSLEEFGMRPVATKLLNPDTASRPTCENEPPLVLAGTSSETMTSSTSSDHSSLASSESSSTSQDSTRS